jgi:hypothetical protein
MVIDLDNQTIHASKFQITIDGKIKSKDAIIDDSNITGGILKSSNYVLGNDEFASSGTKIDLSTGVFTAKKFKIDSSGNAVFKGDIEGSTITGSTITGGTLQTSLTGQRIVIDGTTNDLIFYNSSGNSSIKIGLETLNSTLYPTLTINNGRLYLSGSSI